MKRRELNALCRSTCHLLLSRNNDINGYWGIGVLCRLIIGSGRWETAFRVVSPGVVRIFGCELTQSESWTKTLFDLGVESVEGRLVFIRNGQYENRSDRYLVSVMLGMLQGNRMGMGIIHGHCWPHDPTLESSREYVPPPKISYVPPSVQSP
jgi:hypothetical protein